MSPLPSLNLGTLGPEAAGGSDASKRRWGRKLRWVQDTRDGAGVSPLTSVLTLPLVSQQELSVTTWQVRGSEVVREISLKERKRIVPGTLIELDVSFDIGKKTIRRKADCRRQMWLLYCAPVAAVTVPQTTWLRTTHIYPLMVLEVRNRK